MHTPIGQGSLLAQDYYDDSDCRETCCFRPVLKIVTMNPIALIHRQTLGTKSQKQDFSRFHTCTQR